MPGPPQPRAPGMSAPLSYAFDTGDLALAHSRSSVCASAMTRCQPSALGSRTSSLTMRSSGHL
eukprot:8112041-Pyramimonas_sp.AAC.1